MSCLGRYGTLSPSVRPSVHLSVTLFFLNVPPIASSWNFQMQLLLKEVMSKQMVKVTEVKTKFAPIWAFSDHNYSLNREMTTNKAWSGIWEVPYCIPKSFVSFEGHAGHTQIIANFDRIERFWTVAAVWIHRWLWKLEAVKQMCLTVFQCDLLSNFMVTWGKKTDDLTLIWAFLDGNWNLNSRMAIKWHTWLLTGDKPLSEPMMTQFNDSYMRHSASMS